jgi:hypothetical protein
MYQEKGFKFCLDIRNKGALPLDLACPKRLNVDSPTVLPYPLLERRSDLTPLT